MRTVRKSENSGDARNHRLSQLALACAGLGLVAFAGCNPPKPAAPPVTVKPAPPAPPPIVVQEPVKEPEVEPASLYFPHAPGSSWEFSEKSGDQVSVTRLVIPPRASTSESGAVPKTFLVETYRDNELVNREGYRADKDQLLRDAAGQPDPGAIEPPMPVLQFPLTTGATWKWKGALSYSKEKYPGEAIFKVAGPEEVKTPAGPFQAYRVEQKITIKIEGQTTQVTNTQWYAEKVGPVKMVTVGSGILTTAELTGFRLGDTPSTPPGPAGGTTGASGGSARTTGTSGGTSTSGGGVGTSGGRAPAPAGTGSAPKPKR